MKKLLYLAAALIISAGAATMALWPADDIGTASRASALTPSEKVARGAYLARAGDCMTCHTSRSGAPYAGGRVLPTPFGNIISPNITSDREHGIGSWSMENFWHALHNGQGKDGHLLYPAFPYTNYTKIGRDDVDALYAFLQTVPANKQANRAHELRFPYNLQLALSAWRALYFRPAVFHAESSKSIEWNRGAYLVQGLGHCSACHSSRNPLGASADTLSGGMIPIQGWYAPSLTSDTEAGLGLWQSSHIVALLKSGVSPRATVFGPMAEVVQASLQYMSTADVTAMALYLKTLPGTEAEQALQQTRAQEQQAKRTDATTGNTRQRIQAGAKLYETWCAKCHQADGRGNAPAYPPLAGNNALTMEQAVNPIRIVLNGGFAPGTMDNPRPYGMPAFGPLLSDREVADVVSYLRASWGNHAPSVSSSDVNRYRSVPLD